MRPVSVPAQRTPAAAHCSLAPQQHGRRRARCGACGGSCELLLTTLTPRRLTLLGFPSAPPPQRTKQGGNFLHSHPQPIPDGKVHGRAVPVRRGPYGDDVLLRRADKNCFSPDGMQTAGYRLLYTAPPRYGPRGTIPTSSLHLQEQRLLLGAEPRLCQALLRCAIFQHAPRVGGGQAVAARQDVATASATLHIHKVEDRLQGQGREERSRAGVCLQRLPHCVWGEGHRGTNRHTCLP